MRDWNLGDLKAELKFVLNANTGITDQAVTATAVDIDRHYRNALNEAYIDEVEEAMQIGDIRNFITTTTTTWPSGQVTFDARPMSELVLHKVEDITDSDPGAQLWFEQWADGVALFWKNAHTIQWGTSGPSSDRTIRFTHVAEPNELVEDFDEPNIMPRRFRHLIAWSAAVILRVVMDEAAPRPFIKRRDDIRARYHKSLSMGKPMQTGFPGVAGGSWDIGTLGGGIGTSNTSL